MFSLVFAMRFLEGMKTKDIANTLGITAGQVSSQFHRAIGKIRQILIEHINNDKKEMKKR